jgi:hypothetical protein
LNDPQSLHKYLYTHADPVNGIDPSGLFTAVGLACSIGIGAMIGAGIGGAVSYMGGGDTTSILLGAGKGAIFGAIGGALYPILSTMSIFTAGAIGLSTAATLWVSAIGTNILTGMVIGMLDAYIEDKDIFEGAATGMLFGLLFSPIGVYGNQISKQFSTIWKNTTDKTSKVIGDFFHAGSGKHVGLGRKILRTFWEDRQTFNASREFFARWRRQGLKLEGWSMEHMIIKQRWYREGGPHAVANPILRKVLQGVGNSGINLVPMPMSWNTYFHHHWVQGALFNYGTYAGALTVEYLIYKLSYTAGTVFWEDIFSPDNDE